MFCHSVIIYQPAVCTLSALLEGRFGLLLRSTLCTFLQVKDGRVFYFIFEHDSCSLASVCMQSTCGPKTHHAHHSNQFHYTRGSPAGLSLCFSLFGSCLLDKSAWLELWQSALDSDFLSFYFSKRDVGFFFPPPFCRLASHRAWSCTEITYRRIKSFWTFSIFIFKMKTPLTSY